VAEASIGKINYLGIEKFTCNRLAQVAAGDPSSKNSSNNSSSNNNNKQQHQQGHQQAQQLQGQQQTQHQQQQQAQQQHQQQQIQHQQQTQQLQHQQLQQQTQLQQQPHQNHQIQQVTNLTTGTASPNSTIQLIPLQVGVPIDCQFLAAAPGGDQLAALKMPANDQSSQTNIKTDN